MLSNEIGDPSPSCRAFSNSAGSTLNISDTSEADKGAESNLELKEKNMKNINLNYRYIKKGLQCIVTSIQICFIIILLFHHKVTEVEDRTI